MVKNTTFSNWLDEELITQKKSSAWLSDQIGLSRQSVCYLRSGQRKPSFDTLIDIADALNCRVVMERKA